MKVVHNRINYSLNSWVVFICTFLYHSDQQFPFDKLTIENKWKINSIDSDARDHFNSNDTNIGHNVQICIFDKIIIIIIIIEEANIFYTKLSHWTCTHIHLKIVQTAGCEKESGICLLDWRAIQNVHSLNKDRKTHFASQNRFKNGFFFFFFTFTRCFVSFILFRTSNTRKVKKSVYIFSEWFSLLFDIACTIIASTSELNIIFNYYV